MFSFRNRWISCVEFTNLPLSSEYPWSFVTQNICNDITEKLFMRRFIWIGFYSVVSFAIVMHAEYKQQQKKLARLFWTAIHCRDNFIASVWWFYVFSSTRSFLFSVQYHRTNTINNTWTWQKHMFTWRVCIMCCKRKFNWIMVMMKGL